MTFSSTYCSYKYSESMKPEIWRPMHLTHHRDGVLNYFQVPIANICKDFLLSVFTQYSLSTNVLP
jgi:hypothetical protein